MGHRDEPGVSARRRGGGAPAVARIMDRATVEALLLFTSRASVDAFMEGFFPEESFGARQELERPSTRS